MFASHLTMSPLSRFLLAIALPFCVVAKPVKSDETRESLSACAASLNGILPSPTPSGYVFSGNIRKYYVAAEEVEWNYTPTGWDNWLGVGVCSHQ